MERRLAAILAADVVGYSGLMEKDEVGTLAALKGHREELIDPKVAAHKGRVVKLMGDGALVEFASVVDAVECAVEIQQVMAERNAKVQESKRIALRIGINLGDVIVEGDDLYGDGVNIAARLEAMSIPGGICISGKVYDELIGKVQFGFEDLGEQDIKNIDRPVRIYRVVPSASAAEASVSADRGLPLSDKPSIVVLPFSNIGGEPEQDHFADGITEDIITELSRFHTLFVIARSSAFAYKGRAANLREIAQDLGVQYAVEGGVRRAGDRVRVTVQLVEARTGKHLWAERYDRDLDDIFAIQDDVSRRVVNSLASQVTAEELGMAKRKPPKEWQAYDYWLQGHELEDRWTAEDDAAAKDYFEKVIEIDPTLARAYAGLAGIHEMTLTYHPGHPRAEDDMRKAFDYAERAIELDDTDARPHVSLAWILMFRRQFDVARHHLDRATALNPSDADVLMNRAIMLAFLGDFEDALSAGKQALQLNPHHPDSYFFKIGGVYLMAGRYHDAVSALRRIRNPLPENSAWLAAALAHLGRLEEARGRAQDFVQRMADAWSGDPDATDEDYVNWLVNWAPIRRQEDIDQLLDGLRKAGLPG